MRNYPIKFSGKSQSLSGTQTTWITSAEHFNQEIAVAVPPEFDGPGGGLSPEDLYSMALQNCFIATFKVIAEKSKLQYQSISVDSVLEVDRDENGRPWMARIDFNIKLSGAAQLENAQRILEKTSQSCLVLNSVKTQKTFHYELIP